MRRTDDGIAGFGRASFVDMKNHDEEDPVARIRDLVSEVGDPLAQLSAVFSLALRSVKIDSLHRARDPIARLLAAIDGRLEDASDDRLEQSASSFVSAAFTIDQATSFVSLIRSGKMIHPPDRPAPWPSRTVLSIGEAILPPDAWRALAYFQETGLGPDEEVVDIDLGDWMIGVSPESPDDDEIGIDCASYDRWLRSIVDRGVGACADHALVFLRRHPDDVDAAVNSLAAYDLWRDLPIAPEVVEAIVASLRAYAVSVQEDADEDEFDLHGPEDAS